MKNIFKCLVKWVFLFFVFRHIALADTDYNQAKQFLDAGEILPLEKILARLPEHSHERILDVGLETDSEQTLYEIELIDNKGLVWKLKVNAKTGKVIERKQDD